jgi:peroxiredoxin
LGQLQKLVSEIDTLGLQLVGISPDPVDKLVEIREKVELTFTLLSDPDFTAAKALGIAFKKGNQTLPVPSLFVLAPNGSIQYLYVNPNYRERLDDLVLIAMARDVSRRFELAR